MTYITKLNQKDNDIAIIFTCSCKCYSSNSLVMMIYQLNIKGVSISFSIRTFYLPRSHDMVQGQIIQHLDKVCFAIQLFYFYFSFFLIFFFFRMFVYLIFLYYIIQFLLFCFYGFWFWGLRFYLMIFLRGGGVFIMIGSSKSINSYIFMTE